MRAAIYRQFRKPEGLLGRMAGWIMASRSSNQERNRWTIDLLDLQPGDRVLEIGYGPGLALALAAERITSGEIAGIDHSSVMLGQAAARNSAAIQAGRMRLSVGGLDDLGSLGGPFDKVYSVNVAMFWTDRIGALAAIRRVMHPGALLAATHQPRHPGAKPEDAEAFAQAFSVDLDLAGFQNILVKHLLLQPMPVICILGNAGP
jgi:ubiquinone/menaquinone biosynthesis C-methylase UbiE